jgi:flagellar biosynthesis protein FlhA
MIAAQVKRTQTDIGLMMDPNLTHYLLEELNRRIEQLSAQGYQPILVTSAEVRLPFRRFFEPSFPQLMVLSYQEFPGTIQIQAVSIIPLPQELNPMMHQENHESAFARAG